MNDSSLLLIALDALALLVGLVGGYYFSSYISKKRNQDAQDLATRIVEEARKEADATRKEARLQAQDEIFGLKKEQEQEFKDREQTLKREQARLQEKEERLESKLEKVAQKESGVVELEKRLIKQEKSLAEKEEQLAAAADSHERKLQEISGLTVEEAKERLMTEVESRTRHEAARMIRNIETEAKEVAGKKAKEILSLAIQRYAGDYVSEQTVTAVPLPSEEMKGRIIGREGRNIRALEAATGVDLIIDDTPETVVLSAYSPLRREVAKQALERLIHDGRIHPARIEDIVRKVEQEMDVKLREIGEQATFDVGVHGRANGDIGRARVRSARQCGGYARAHRGQDGGWGVLRRADGRGDRAENSHQNAHDEAAEQRQSRGLRGEGRKGAGEDERGEGKLNDNKQHADQNAGTQGREAAFWCCRVVQQFLPGCRDHGGNHTWRAAETRLYMFCSAIFLRASGERWHSLFPMRGPRLNGKPPQVTNSARWPPRCTGNPAPRRCRRSSMRRGQPLAPGCRGGTQASPRHGAASAPGSCAAANAAPGPRP